MIRILVRQPMDIKVTKLIDLKKIIVYAFSNITISIVNKSATGDKTARGDGDELHELPTTARMWGDGRKPADRLSYSRTVRGITAAPLAIRLLFQMPRSPSRRDAANRNAEA
jgi:hypothetical protein